MSASPRLVTPRETVARARWTIVAAAADWPLTSRVRLQVCVCVAW